MRVLGGDEGITMRRRSKTYRNLSLISIAGCVTEVPLVENCLQDVSSGFQQERPNIEVKSNENQKLEPSQHHNFR